MGRRRQEKKKILVSRFFLFIHSFPDDRKVIPAHITSASLLLKASLSAGPDILALLIAMLAGCISIQAKPCEQMAINFKYY